MSLFEQAAAKEHPGAQFAMGALLGGGHDVPTDRVAAQAWFTKAADKGHPFAQLMLGRYLSKGLGGETDPVRAEKMLQRAAEAGIAEAARDLAALRSSAEPAIASESEAAEARRTG